MEESREISCSLFFWQLFHGSFYGPAWHTGVPFGFEAGWPEVAAFSDLVVHVGQLAANNQSLAGASPLKDDIPSGLPVNWEILITAKDSGSLELVLHDCILQVFPRLFPSSHLRPAVR
jgi:hypothetical protein